MCHMQSGQDLVNLTWKIAFGTQSVEEDITLSIEYV